ncbi:peptidase M50 [Oscillibacter sp. MSJ-2]|uniref:Peptidase M50 n=1 Tax=Dysosmobacter acutus TaxID=2841504 RepID=A0ABS6F9Q2_9FIRM|nr:site-2 protease family protein [Dysosmobacter acutus]MBU5627031.1 peptidase M50 [Dysosmobacter acutus]
MSRCLEIISPGFLLLVTAFALQQSGELLASILLASGLHEIGHWAALRFFGVRAERFRLAAWGAGMVCGAGLSYGQELIAVIAGPAVNLICGVACARAAEHMGWTSGYLYAGAHVILGAFNLLPISVLDGGRAIELILSLWADPWLARRIVSILSIFTLVLLTSGALWLSVQSGGNAYLLVGILGVWSMLLRRE